MINIELLKKAISIWGHDSQVEMMHEECLELALALQKYKRDNICPVMGMDNIYDEIADVKIMMAQADLLFNKSKIDERIIYKMNRLADTLNKTKCTIVQK